VTLDQQLFSHLEMNKSFPDSEAPQGNILNNFFSDDFFNYNKKEINYFYSLHILK